MTTTLVDRPLSLRARPPEEVARRGGVTTSLFVRVECQSEATRTRMCATRHRAAHLSPWMMAPRAASSATIRRLWPSEPFVEQVHDNSSSQS